MDARRYVEALDSTKVIFEQAKQENLGLEMIDIGGGFPVRYVNEDIDLGNMCKTIVDHYKMLFGGEVALAAEPGRSIVGDAAVLVTKVISESVREGRRWLYFDDGTYGSFLEVLLYKMKFPMRTNTSGNVTNYVLAGPTCDCIDVFSRNTDGNVCEVALPEMHVDDLLIVGSMGAYTYSESTRFNGFDPPKFVYID
jgi:ornithine decarboxylase